MRMGRELAARRRWQTALELNPDLDLAAHNLADFDVPVDERHAPWPYTINYWMQREIVEELLRELGGGRQRSEEQLTQGARRFLQRHPHLGALVPLLLERGDPAGREFALRLAGLAQTPELLAALATFAQSRHGPTAMRLQAAQFAQRAGVLPNGTVRFWQRGEWHDTLMFGMELSGEPTKSDLPPQITELQREAFMAQGEGNYTRAEQLLQQALAQAPSEPGLLNNLGALYGKTGRNAEAKAIITRLATEHPDYVFGRTNFVPYLIDEGKIDEAKALIEPLMRRSQMHLSEFGAVASAQVSIALAEGNLEAAESWLGMWEQAYPDHPHLEIFRNRLQQARRTGRKRRRMEL
jgi:tetratricopeptide (TPR) repeat protein